MLKFDIWNRNTKNRIKTICVETFYDATQILIKHAQACRGTTFIMTKPAKKRMPNKCYGKVYFPRK